MTLSLSFKRLQLIFIEFTRGRRASVVLINILNRVPSPLFVAGV